MPPKVVKASPLTQIKEIEDDPLVRSLINENLPPNYDFEIGKTIWRIRKLGCKTVALQFPEGLLIFSTKIGDILKRLTSVDIIIMGDITYGACCIDDFTASMLGAELLVHYGHSCLVPTVVANKIDTIYVFVTIKFSLPNAVLSIGNLLKTKANEMKHSNKIQIEGDTKTMRVSLVATIQFADSLGVLKTNLSEWYAANCGDEDLPVCLDLSIPRSKPLSNGEILGCTAPTVKGCDLIVYVGDGRFHLEAMMMANPLVEAYRYDPYNTTLTHESFNHDQLNTSRLKSISKLQACTTRTPARIGVILGTLGRQGNPLPMEYVYEKLKNTTTRSYSPFVILMSEVMPAKLNLFKDVDGWVQFACPRLSIDWGEAFERPVLTPFEAVWCVGKNNDCCGKNNTDYSHPMDYYAYDSTGYHTPNFKEPSCSKKK